MNENELSKIIVESAIEVHKNLGGPGLLENVYEEALVWEILQRDVLLERQLIVPIVYKGNSLASPLRLDIKKSLLKLNPLRFTTRYLKRKPSRT